MPPGAAARRQAGTGRRRPGVRPAAPGRPASRPSLGLVAVAGLARALVEAERRGLGGVGKLEQILVGLAAGQRLEPRRDLARGPVSTMAPLIFPLNFSKSASDLASK